MADAVTFYRDGMLVRDTLNKDCWGYSKKEFAESLLGEWAGYNEVTAAAVAICVWDLYAKVEVSIEKPAND